MDSPVTLRDASSGPASVVSGVKAEQGEAVPSAPDVWRKPDEASADHGAEHFLWVFPVALFVILAAFAAIIGFGG